jgi:hypothetical protein
LLVVGDKGIEIVYIEEKIFCIGPTRAAKAEQKSLVPAQGRSEPTKKGPLSFVLFESQFTLVSTIRRGHPSLVSGLVASGGRGLTQ